MKDDHRSNIYLQMSLDVISYYIRGNINLNEAITQLSDLGHSKKSIKKVLNETVRNNIYTLHNFKKRK